MGGNFLNAGALTPETCAPRRHHEPWIRRLCCGQRNFTPVPINRTLRPKEALLGRPCGLLADAADSLSCEVETWLSLRVTTSRDMRSKSSHDVRAPEGRAPIRFRSLAICISAISTSDPMVDLKAFASAVCSEIRRFKTSNCFQRHYHHLTHHSFLRIV